MLPQFGQQAIERAGGSRDVRRCAPKAFGRSSAGGISRASGSDVDFADLVFPRLMMSLRSGPSQRGGQTSIKQAVVDTLECIHTYPKIGASGYSAFLLFQRPPRRQR